ncbi:FAD binding domain-containing protein [Aspergillus egyptiacus]|nr:FAD binding domain-containing protein [Aspergillus egyptiacus]
MAKRTSKTDLLIIGAGPAGLMAACWASQYGMSTRLIDEKADRTGSGHADGIQSRTLEIFDSFGVVDPILRKGVREVEMSYWGPNERSKNLECQSRARSQPERLSRYGQMLLKQGEVEQILIDYLNETARVKIERQKRADTIYFTEDETHPVSVITKSLRTDKMINVLQQSLAGKSGAAEVTEIIQARYVVACDGAKSLVRHQLEVPFESEATGSMWGVIDIVPITDFPDIRQSCAIHSEKDGSIMTAPRENGLVRFYVQLTGESDLDKLVMESSPNSPDALIQLVQRIIKPYTLRYEYCDWWSFYPIKQGLVNHYSLKNRVFLAGDAAHTHSPKAGQGMNVSIQDTYNLIWKLGSVITGSLDEKILETYHLERHPVAEQLMKMDTILVQAYEQTTSESEVSQVREDHAGFMSGTEVTYPANVLIASKDQCDTTCARNIKLGMRMRSVPVVNEADASTIHFATALPSTGAWRLVVFSGDLGRKENMDRLAALAESFLKQPHLSGSRSVQSRDRKHLVIEPILIHPGRRRTVNFLELPEIFHPFDDKLGWDYGKIFADDGDYGDKCGHAYDEYGISKEDGGIVLCRPDQHVAWMGRLHHVAQLAEYFSAFHSTL